MWPAPFQLAAAAIEVRPIGPLRPSGASRVAVCAKASRSDAAQVADSNSHKRVVITGMSVPCRVQHLPFHVHFRAYDNMFSDAGGVCSVQDEGSVHRGTAYYHHMRRK